MRKHWSEYPPDKVCYGSWKISNGRKIYYGFGAYTFDHLGNIDVWLDYECSSPEEKEEYKKYCKDRKFTNKESLQ